MQNVNRVTLKLYWHQVRKHRPSFFAMLILIPLGALLIDTVLPYTLSQAIGELTSHNMDAVYPLLWMSAGVGLLGAALNFLGFQSMAIHESQTIADLREHTFISLIKKDNHFFVNQKIGAMTSKYIDFVRSEITLQDLFIIRTLGFILTVGGGIAILFAQSWKVACIVLGLIILIAVQIKLSSKFRAPWRKERKELVSHIHGHVADALTNYAVVKSYAGEEREITLLQEYCDRFRKIYRKEFVFIAGENSARVAVMIFVQVVAITAAVQLIASNTINIATAVFMLAYMQRIGSQIFTMAEIIMGYDQALLDASPMTEMLSEKVRIEDRKRATQLDASNPTISFENVTYRYEDSSSDVLKSISLNIPAGQKIGLVGHSGAGKTTFINLLLRFDDVTDGAVRINNQDIRDVTQHSLREAVGYVPQEPMLFHRTLRENIAYGSPNASVEDIREAASKAHALQFIEELPQGFDTLVGERGIKLSGGQRQRVAIARAILKNAPILILDEATSALDSESERLIQDSLANLMEGRTSIVIAHRLSTIAKLDQIVVLSNGTIAEQGKHSELLDRGGVYAKLWSHQSGGFIEE